ncbi:unnamed protein product [Peniophora sp. CBMAI 1063]|nr:unnamed protein product [Peniophora sp. CBMAI 1063]
MGVALRAILAVLALGPLAVLGNFDTVSFSPVEQCGAFNVSFGGGVAPDALPLILTVIPFNASPIYIQIPEDAWNSTSATGAAITFLPLAAGTNFLASLDDAYGRPTGVNTSDIILVAASPSNDSSCLNGVSLAQPSTYAISGDPSQCVDTAITFNASTVTSAPSVRAFVPRGPSFELSQTNATDGEANYLMNITRGTQVALLFDGGDSDAQTSDLFTVFGDTSSPTSCIASSAASSTQALGETSSSSGSLSRVSIIVIAISTVAVTGTLSLLALIFVARERRKRRTAQLHDQIFPRSDPEKVNPYASPVQPSDPPPFEPRGPPPPPGNAQETTPAPAPAHMADMRQTRVLTGTPYGNVSPRSNTNVPLNMPDTPKTPKSAASSIFVLPSPPPPPILTLPQFAQRSSAQRSSARTTPGRHGSLASVNARTLADLDIERMLEEAALTPGLPSGNPLTGGMPSGRPSPPSPGLSPRVMSPSSRLSPVSAKRDAHELDVPSSATYSDFSHSQASPATPSFRSTSRPDPPPFSAGVRSFAQAQTQPLNVARGGSPHAV